MFQIYCTWANFSTQRRVTWGTVWGVGQGHKQSLIMSPNTIWADSNSAKKSFVNYIWSRLVFPLGAIVLPLSKLFIACVSRGGKVASYQGCGYCVATFAYHGCTENVDSVDNKALLLFYTSITPSRGNLIVLSGRYDTPPQCTWCA